ncbi:MAG: 3-dehydroquinate synthase [Candidatus Omnitrophica bacterium]|jgi:3-dehydroquinate synthase|nr:3-dehydroquinate synthase [Candidatus Omnitrophota bacterium]
MRKIRLNLGQRSYEILIGRHAIDQLGKYLKKLDLGTDAYILTNKLIKAKYGSQISQALLKSGFNCYFKLVADSEKSKSIACVGGVINDIARRDFKKRIFIIAFGGGVIGDLAGFVASVYKRGIPYIQVPTTLLAQVDSSIGGKTGVDLCAGKNLVGAFYQPKLVLSDTAFLKSLSTRQLKAGLAEVIKYALIADKNLFNLLLKKRADILKYDPSVLEKLVYACSLIKSGLVSRDEKEALDKRTLLNFGHTLGHAIEAAGGFSKYNHGEAISLGMLAAIEISKNLELLKVADAQAARSLIKFYGLPEKIGKLSLAKIISAHFHDKKFKGNKNKFVLLVSLGKAKVVTNVGSEFIRGALKSIS